MDNFPITIEMNGKAANFKVASLPYNYMLSFWNLPQLLKISSYTNSTKLKLLGATVVKLC